MIDKVLSEGPKGDAQSGLAVPGGDKERHRSETRCRLVWTELVKNGHRRPGGAQLVTSTVRSISDSMAANRTSESKGLVMYLHTPPSLAFR
jgi:hypothetical protein